jgi:GT2 family glycosyltransferase
MDNSTEPSGAQSARFHVIIVLHNSAAWVEPCLSSLQAQSLQARQITIFDNASTDDGVQRVEKYFPEIRLMRSPVNIGFAGGNNRAAKVVRDCDYILLLNADTILAINALEEFAGAFASHPQLGVVGCKVLEGDVETIQHIGINMRDNGLTNNLGQGEPDEGQYHGVIEANSVLGAAMAVRQEVWTELGGLDERFFPAYYEETDFCYRSRAHDWGVGVACDATVTHFDAQKNRRTDPVFLEMFFRSRAHFLKKHYRFSDWLTRFLPDEIRWLFYWGSKGMRRIALKTLLQVMTGRAPKPSDIRSPY